MTERLTRERKGPVRSLLNHLLNVAQIEACKKAFAALMPINDLHLIAYLYGTDKWGYHNYIDQYQRHFRALRNARINLLEIGIGGYEKPNSGGESLRMWKKYFPHACIYGVDIFDKSGVNEKRIKTFRGSQNDPEFLAWVVNQIGKLDVVIDDGSHINEHIVTSFDVLFPLLQPNGLYVIEDLQTSYWSNYGGNSIDFNDPKTAMCTLKALTDGLNHQDFITADHSPSYFDTHVVGVHFYHNMAFIEKGLNNEPPGAMGRPSL